MTEASTLARKLFSTVSLDRDSWDGLRVGDWLTCDGWSRPRLVQEKVDRDGVFIAIKFAEPDEVRANEKGFRSISYDDFCDRTGWKSYPYLRIMWVRHGDR